MLRYRESSFDHSVLASRCGASHTLPILCHGSWTSCGITDFVHCVDGVPCLIQSPVCRQSFSFLFHPHAEYAWPMSYGWRLLEGRFSMTLRICYVSGWVESWTLVVSPDSTSLGLFKIPKIAFRQVSLQIRITIHSKVLCGCSLNISSHKHASHTHLCSYRHAHHAFLLTLSLQLWHQGCQLPYTGRTEWTSQSDSNTF